MATVACSTGLERFEPEDRSRILAACESAGVAASDCERELDVIGRATREQGWNKGCVTDLVVELYRTTPEAAFEETIARASRDC